MTVLFYKKNDLSSGFVGFRVATTLGREGDYAQAWFSLNDYSYSKAKQLAYELNDQWRKQADDFTHAQKYCYQSWKTIEDIPGFWGQLKIESKIRMGEKRRYVYPVFSICRRINGLKGQRSFMISPRKNDYLSSWEMAVNYYTEIRHLDSVVRNHLLSIMPDPSYFYDTLYDRHKMAKTLISKQELISKLYY